MQFGEPRDIGNMRGITPAVKYLMIINVAVFFIEVMLRIPLSGLFALRADWMNYFAVGQLFTYMFVHANLLHLFVNMLTLFFIGPTVEKTLGSYRFFILYYLSGILGGLGWSLLAPADSACVGASGAVMGVLGAFGAFYPNSTVLLWFVLPVKTWVLVSILAIWELSHTIGDHAAGGIANAAHLMGGIAGFVYAFSLKHPHILAWFRKKKPRSAGTYSGSRPTPPGGERLSREEIDHILDKIGREGMGALTSRERELLKRATR